MTENNPDRRTIHSRYFEMVGLISVQFAYIDLEIQFLLAKLINPKYEEIAYYFVEKEKGVARKFETVNALVKKEPFNSIFPDELKQKLKQAFEVFNRLKDERNGLLHSILAISPPNEEITKLKKIDLTKDKRAFKVGKEYTMTEMGNLQMEFVDLNIKLNQINNEVIKVLKANESKT